MTRTASYIIVGLILTTVFYSCMSENKSGRTDTYSSGAIAFASDESFSPIIDEERDVFEHTYPDAHLTPIYTNESEAINLLLQDSVWMAITSRDFKPEELQSLKDRKLFPQSIKFAYDGLALIQNKQNTDSCISL